MIGSAVRIDLHPDLYPKVVENFSTFALVCNQLVEICTQKKMRLNEFTLFPRQEIIIFILMPTMQLLFDIKIAYHMNNHAHI